MLFVTKWKCNGNNENVMEIMKMWKFMKRSQNSALKKKKKNKGKKITCNILLKKNQKQIIKN